MWASCWALESGLLRGSWRTLVSGRSLAKERDLEFNLKRRAGNRTAFPRRLSSPSPGRLTLSTCRGQSRPGHTCQCGASEMALET